MKGLLLCEIGGKALDEVRRSVEVKLAGESLALGV